APCYLWEHAQTPLVGVKLGEFRPLMQRVDPKKIAQMMEASMDAESDARAQSAAATSWNDPGDALAAEPLAPQCTIDDFGKIDLRVARIVQAEEVKEARKLLKLTVSLGGDERRTIFAGIKAAYEPAQLVGRLVVIVANLAPRQMKFGLSEGMVVAAGTGGGGLFVLSPDSGAKPGQRVH